MAYKIFPYLLLIVGILGFFINTPPTDSTSANQLVNATIAILNMPWWGNLICIFIGIVWLWLSGGTSEEEQSN